MHWILNTDKQHDFGPFATHCVYGWLLAKKYIKLLKKCLRIVFNEIVL